MPLNRLMDYSEATISQITEDLAIIQPGGTLNERAPLSPGIGRRGSEAGRVEPGTGVEALRAIAGKGVGHRPGGRNGEGETGMFQNLGASLAVWVRDLRSLRLR
jgi:hypothetical protein